MHVFIVGAKRFRRAGSVAPAEDPDSEIVTVGVTRVRELLGRQHRYCWRQRLLLRRKCCPSLVFADSFSPCSGGVHIHRHCTTHFRCAEVLSHRTFQCVVGCDSRRDQLCFAHVPHCEERPGAAYSRSTSVYCGLAVSPRKPRSHTVRSGLEPHTPGGTKSSDLTACRRSRCLRHRQHHPHCAAMCSCWRPTSSPDSDIFTVDPDALHRYINGQGDAFLQCPTLHLRQSRRDQSLSCFSRTP